jgi:hypothetical protein
MNKYRVCARRNQSVMELYVDLMNLKGEWIEVFHSIDAEDVRRYLRTRTDPEAEITWEVA